MTDVCTFPHSKLPTRVESYTSQPVCVTPGDTSAAAVEPVVSLARCEAPQAACVAQADIYFVSSGEKGLRKPDGFLQARCDPHCVIAPYGDRCTLSLAALVIPCHKTQLPALLESSF